tara:strand:+ start:107 stop:562 length:456 start_codon:yes stop_codon:yes gene_type:complete
MGDDKLIRDSNVPLPDPRYWGSKFWFTMHTVAYFYPDEPTVDEMLHAKHFYESLKILLPCPGCAQHYSELLERFPIHGAVTSRMNLMTWVNKIHNEVNRKLGKPLLSLEEYLMMNRNLEKPPLITYEPIIAGLILALFFLIFVRREYIRKV